jgi:hypothetical protein
MTKTRGHMIELLSKEAAHAGTPFNPDEKKILRSKASSGEAIPEELRRKSKTLIEQLLNREKAAETRSDPKSFNNSLGWAGESSYPNIVALTEEVVTSGTDDVRLHGRRWVKDQIQLLGCAVVVRGPRATTRSTIRIVLSSNRPMRPLQLRSRIFR